MNGITIKNAVQSSGLSENYIRKMIAKGELITTKELVPGTANNWRNVIQNWDEWRESTKAHSPREDGRNKFVIYMNADEEAELRKLLAGMTIENFLSRANLKKETTEAE